MEYKVNHNGVNCILPVFTLGIKRRVDTVNEKISDASVPLDDRVSAMHEFLTDTIGAEALAKALGSTGMDEVDLNDMNILYLKITKEYDRPVVDFNKPELDANTRKMLQELNTAASSVSSIQQAAKK